MPLESKATPAANVARPDRAAYTGIGVGSLHFPGGDIDDVAVVIGEPNSLHGITY
jgi:hypothetical protein